MQIGKTLVVLAALLAATATAGRAAGVDHAGLARQVIDAHIRPEAHAFADAAGALPASLDALCMAPTDAHLKESQDRFATAALAFARIQHLRFGALREQNRFERLLLYPDPKGLVRRQVEKALAAGDQGLVTAGALYGKSVALQGFSALELLLYGEASKQTLGVDALGRLRCGYARAIGANIARIAADIDRSWQDRNGYSALMLSPGADNAAYLEPKEVTLEIIKSFLDGLEHARDAELAAPLGVRAQDQAPTTGILELSGLSIPFLAADLEGLVHLYHAGGLQSLAGADDKLLAEEAATEIETAIASAKSVTQPLAEARSNVDEKRKLIAMGFPLRNAYDLAFDMLASATGLSLGFKAGDGD